MISSGENYMINKINKKINNLQKSIRYNFKEIDLLYTALSHPSYAHENNLPHYKSNQRLEFLGDAVLGLTVSEMIYNEYPNFPEGHMTKVRANVVRESTLARIARDVSLGEFLYLGKGEESTGGRQRTSILADALEALIGAIYIDGGIEKAKLFVKNYFNTEIKETIQKQSYRDFKSTLQELIQRDNKEKLFYEVIGESGPDHDKNFTVQVKFCNKILGKGTGKSKKEAEQAAAKSALKDLDIPI